MSTITTLTQDEARALDIQGWNLRCNRCGTYGATWLPCDLRNRLGLNRSLCPSHQADLLAEIKRHDQAMSRLLSAETAPATRRGVAGSDSH